MDPLLGELRAAYRRHPGYVIAFAMVCAAIGITVGYRIIGPAIFG